MADEQTTEESPNKSKTPLIIAGISVASLLGGGAGGYFAKPTIDELLGGDQQEEVAVDDDGQPIPPQADRSEITEVGDFTVNLRNNSGGRLLQMAVSIENSVDDSDQIEERIPQLQDTIVLLASDFSYDELDGMDGKMRMRDEILAQINKVLAPTVVDRVYFTSFVVQ